METKSSEHITAIPHQSTKVDDLFTVSVSPLSDEKYTWDETIKIYPNMITDNFSIILHNNYFGKVYFSVVELSGAVLLEGTVEKEASKLEANVNLDQLPSGNYLFEIRTDQHLCVKKIIKH